MKIPALALLLALTGCSGSTPQDPPPASGTWAVVQKNLSGALYSVYAPAADDVWAAGTDPDAGTGPLVLHFDGHGWLKLATGTAGSLRWIHGFAGGPVFIGGDGGTILRTTDGKTFEKMDTPSTSKVWGVWGAAPDDVWAVGGEPEGGGFVWHYDGTSWTDVDVPAGVSGGAVFKVWGRSKTDVFMVGTLGLMLHYKGGTLEKEDTGVNATLFTVNGNGSKVVAVGGYASGVLVESTGDGTWQHSTVPTNGSLIGVCAATSGTFSCGEQATILERKPDGTWKRLPGSDLQTQDLHAITVDPSGGIWSVGGDLNAGTDGVLLHYGDKVPTGIDAGSALILAAALAACGGNPAPQAIACPERGTICRIAGTGELAFNHDGHKALDTALYLISAVQRGPDGLLYLMDFNNFRLRVIEPDDTVRTAVGSGEHAVATDGAPALGSPLENPIDFAFDRDGSIVIVELHDPRVLRIGKDGLVHVIAGDFFPGNDGDGGPALQAQFLELHSVAIDDQGAIYLADGSGHRVRKISPDGTIDAFAGTGSDLPDDGDGLPALAANMGTPEALAVGPDGSVYIAISEGSMLRKVRPDGIIETLAGDGHAGFAGDGGPAKDAILSRPAGVAVAADGTVYVADTGNNRIRRIRTDGIIETIAGDGKAGTAGDNGPALAAELHGPARLALDGDSLLVADQLSSCARRIRLR